MIDPKSASDYAIAAREPELWLSQANTLRRAAALVYEELGEAVRDGWRAHPEPYDQLALMKPFMLLSELAIENVLKGVLILRRPEVATDIALSKKGWRGRHAGRDRYAPSPENLTSPRRSRRVDPEYLCLLAAGR